MYICICVCVCVYIYIYSAFVGLDNKLYKMHGTYRTSQFNTMLLDIPRPSFNCATSSCSFITTAENYIRRV